MSLNFPTAFWKTDVDPSVIGTSISWESALWWSHGDGTPTYNNFTLKQNTNFPFTVDTNEYYPDYYFDSDENIERPYADFLQTASTCYFGWFLDGGPDDANPAPGKNDLSDYHKAEPWTLGVSGHRLSIEYESDQVTAVDSGIDNVEEIFNQFAQSGDATGTFRLTSSSDLEITVSGLAKDTSYQSVNDNRISQQLGGNTTGPNSPFCNSMTLHLYSPVSNTETLIGSGAAPRDNRLLSNAALRYADDLNEAALWYNMDVQQVKLYSGNNLSTIINTTESPKGEPRLQSTLWVEQNSRIDGYCTADGIGTFHGGALNSLSAGVDYQIRIKTSTYDNEFNSGAFYGFTFSFS